MMQSILLKTYGAPEDALEIVDQPIPSPKENELLIQVMTASLNPIDCRMRAGYGKAIFSPHAPLPIVLGRDFSGVVVETGKQVTAYKKGDPVWGVTSLFGLKQGSHSEFISVPQSHCMPMPHNHDFVACASIPYVALTTWSALITQNGMSPADYRGKKVLVHAGAGGVGTFAIQFLKALGAMVATTCSTEKVAFLYALGADKVIDYKAEKYAEILHDYDVVYDLLGKEHTEPSLRVLASRPPSSTIQAEIQKLVDQCMQDLENADDQFDVPKYKNILKKFDQAAEKLFSSKYAYVSIVGPMMPLTDAKGFHPGMRAFVLETLQKKAEQLSLHGRKFNYAIFEPNQEALAYVTKMVTEGKIVPQVGQVFSFHAAVDAHKALDTGRTQGKIVLQTG